MRSATIAERMPLAVAVIAALISCALAVPGGAFAASGPSPGGTSAPGPTEAEPKATEPPQAPEMTEAEEEELLDGVSLATWYGPGLFGRHTACGQRLTRRTVGVANRTLPCGTLVEVRYGDRRVTVPVIDRGPYGTLGANWDLTEGAAHLLHMTESERIDATIVGHVKNTPLLGEGEVASASRVASRNRGRTAGSTGGTGA